LCTPSPQPPAPDPRLGILLLLGIGGYLIPDAAYTIAVVDAQTAESASPGRSDVGGVSEALGSQIRAERHATGMTVRALATRTGLSPSLISQVERGRATPSVASLWAIATELGISIADLFNDPDHPNETAADPSGTPSTGRAAQSASPLQPFETRRAITLAGGVCWERLTSATDEEVDFVYCVYPVGAASCDEEGLVRHGGKEFGYVLSGTLGVSIGFDEYVVRTNDSISFDSAMPHRLWAIGDEPARAVWLVINRRSDPRTKSFDQA
jgi:transcriptional regulator with XRE-family HTH domain